MKKLHFLIIFVCLAAISAIVIYSAGAVGFDDIQSYYNRTAIRSGWDPEGDNTPADYVAKVILVMLSIVGPLFVILIIYSGVVWMTSGGETDKIATAKKTIIYAVIGLIIIFSAYSIAYFVATSGGQLTSTNDCNGSCTAASNCLPPNIISPSEACGESLICCTTQ